MSRPLRHVISVGVAVVAGLVLVVVLLVIPVVLLSRLDDKDLDRWAQIG